MRKTDIRHITLRGLALATALLPLAMSSLLSPGPAYAAPSEQGVRASRNRAVKRATGELLRLAKACASNHWDQEARQHSRTALLLGAVPSSAQKILRSLLTRRRERKAKFAEAYKDKHSRMAAAAVSAIKEYRDFCFKTEHAPGRWEAATWIRWFFPDSAAAKDDGWKFFRPYCRFVPDAAHARLSRGDDWWDGRWHDATEVAVLDARHAKWKTRWTLAGLHTEVQANVPLRLALRVAIMAEEYRRLFLATWSGPWPLQDHGKPLRVFVTRTMKGLVDAYKSHYGKEHSGAVSGGFYGGRPGTENGPCFFSTQGKVDSSSKEFHPETVLRILRHEMSHQMAFEFSTKSGMATPNRHYWVVEGFACYMEDFILDQSGWESRHKWRNPSAVRGLDYSRLSSQQSMMEKSLPLKALFGMKRGEFLSGDRHAKYSQATSLIYLLMQESGEDTRSRTIRVVSAVHDGSAERQELASFFPQGWSDGVEGRWRTFMESLEFK